VRRRHFEALQPLCPVCRDENRQFPLAIACSSRERDDSIIEGVLCCTNAQCQCEYPIIDGIPLIIPAIRDYTSNNNNLLAILARDDLSETSESMLGDCCGPGSPFDKLRQQLSSYMWDHYGDLDATQRTAEPKPGSALRLLQTGLEAVPGDPAGPILDVGCGVGRTSFALAERFDHLVLGVDLHYGMLRLAARVLRNETVRYPLRRVGVVYDRRECAAQFARSGNVDFWACDATALPFASGTFAAALGLSVLDSAQAPVEFLRSLRGVLADGAWAVLTCAYDWVATATPFEEWLGGRSQRGPHGGGADSVLRELLASSTQAAMPGFQLIWERDGLPWNVRVHERSTVSYRVHMVVLQAVRGHATLPSSAGRG